MSTQKEVTRGRLLDAARKLLVKRGFHGVALEDIAEAAGVSRQAVYKSHFASKSELLLALVQHLHGAENLDELVRPVHEAKSGLAMLETTIAAIVHIEARIHDIAVVLASAALSDAGAAAASLDRLAVKHGALRAALERTQDEGALNPAWKLDEALDMLGALLSVDSYQQLVVFRGWTPAQLIHRVWEVSEGSFLRRPGRRAPTTRPPGAR